VARNIGRVPVAVNRNSSPQPPGDPRRTMTAP